MITVDYKDRRPIYEQLTANITELALTGELKPDEQLPSVRQLASQLGINPNTISKAYLELERRGVVYSVSGRGSFINSDLTSAAGDRQKELEQRLRECIRDLKRIGAEKDRLLEIIGEEFSRILDIIGDEF